MKAYILTPADIENLRDAVSFRAIHLLENGTADEHRAQAREQYIEMVVRWIERVTK